MCPNRLHFALILPVLLFGCGSEPGDVGLASGANDSLVIELTGVDSVSVFDLLLQEHDVDYVSGGMGVFVKAIDSVENSPGVYWLYSVNDTIAQVAADRYITSDGDRVRWHFRRSGE